MSSFPSPRTETPRPEVTPLISGHFREGPGYATWRPRGTQDWLLMFTLSGSGRVGYADGGATVAGPGDAVLLRPGTLHDYGTAHGAAGWELLWAHFLPRPHWPDLLRWPEAAPGLLRLPLGAEGGPDRRRVEESLWAMHGHATGGRLYRTELAMNSLEAALLWCGEANPRAERASRLDPRVRRATELLLGRLAEPVTLDELAAAVGLSASRLSHLFKEQTGRTPGQFVEAERVARAKQLLALTSRTVAAVAAEVGFENPFYFTLRFKKRVGLSPTDYRRREQARQQESGPAGGEP
jgi:AraC family transcriptional regulator of arabinose operon